MNDGDGRVGDKEAKAVINTESTSNSNAGDSADAPTASINRENDNVRSSLPAISKPDRSPTDSSFIPLAFQKKDQPKNKHPQKKSELKRKSSFPSLIDLQQHSTTSTTPVSPARDETPTKKVHVASPSASASPKDTSTSNSNSTENFNDRNNRSFSNIMSTLSSPTTQPDYTENLTRTDLSFKLISLIGTVVWVALCLVSYLGTAPEHFEYLDGIEKSAAVLTFVILLVSNISRIVPVVVSNQRRGFSGVIIGAIAVQTIAMITDLFLAYLPTPVVIDPITGGRVHLIRWCEWSAVAFIMTFMMEGVDVPHPEHGMKVGLAHAVAQGLSTCGGLLFPFMPGVKSWSCVMCFSVTAFSMLFVRLRSKKQALLHMEKGTAIDEVEIYERLRLSAQLMTTCAVMWGLLVFLYFFAWLAPLLAPTGSWLVSPAIPMISPCFCEIWSKVLYLLIIVDAHEAIFDDGARAERRLEELRNMMGVVWDSSSDIIAISVRGARSGIITTMVSPTYLKLELGNNINNHNDDEGLNSLLFEFGPIDLDSKTTASDYDVDMGGLDKPFQDEIIAKRTHCIQLLGPRPKVKETKMKSPPQSTAHTNESFQRKSLSAMGVLLARAWRTSNEQRETLLMHDLVKQSDGGDTKVRCEAMVTRLETDALVVVVRDISERTKRFEAEKRVVVETTARRKDAEANRFTRHEVKNGLLAAIGLCDSLREAFGGLEESTVLAAGGSGGTQKTSGAQEDETSDMDRAAAAAAVLSNAASTWQRKLQLREGTATGTGVLRLPSSQNLKDGDKLKNETQQDEVVHFDVLRCVSELDATLREVLDTILAEAMARDVIHESYLPRVERVDIRSVLYGVRGCQAKQDRFPLAMHPDPMPQFLVDPQLLRYVHRNAVSNAVKYGQQGGAVSTEVFFDNSKSEIQMNVTNLPGEHYEELRKLGEEAENAVFEPGKRLHPLLTSSETKNQSLRRVCSRALLSPSDMSHSSGDGAWIMHKCAKTLGGNCSIHFNLNQTVFTLRCPVKVVETSSGQNQGSNLTDFRIEPNTWGIAIDDSKIQRKLLERFLSLVGIDKSRCVVLGKDVEEIRGFIKTVVDYTTNNKNDKFLIVADENLDIVVDATHQDTVSGSKCIERIREVLSSEDEQRLLALVRSANDSAKDISLYKKRAHGFLPKAPIRQDRVKEMIAPLWLDRFSSSMSIDPTLPETTNQPREDVSDNNGDMQISRSDLLQYLELIDALCTQGDPSALPLRWPVIWDKLHLLKGDLKTMTDGVRVTAIIEAIDRLRGPDLPNDFFERWNLIKSLVISVI